MRANCTVKGMSQYALPVAGSSPLMPFGSQAINCRTPAATTMTGWAYPGSGSDERARQITSPVRLPKAMKLEWPVPPTSAINRSPSTIGAEVAPYRGMIVPKSFS